MRVAIVLNTSWNIYNFRLNLIKRFLQKGYEVVAIAPRDRFSEKLEELGCTYVPLAMDSRGINPVKDMALTAELISVYRKVKPDVVLHYTIKPNIYGTFAASLLGIPVVNNVCGLGTVFMKKNLLSFVARMMYKSTFWYPKKIFFQNDKDLELFLDYKIISKNSTDILPGSGIDLKRFFPSKGVPQDKTTFLLISRLIFDKGVSEYVEAAKKLKDEGLNVSFQILGSKDPDHIRGIPLETVDSWISDGIVEYLGTTDDVRPYIANADCVVLPSYREGTPRTLLEAASLAKPIVATDVPGCNNVVINGYNGLLCNVRDSADLSKKMKEFIDLSSEERSVMGHNGRKLVEDRFDENIVIDKYLSALDSIAHKSA